MRFAVIATWLVAFVCRADPQQKAAQALDEAVRLFQNRDNAGASRSLQKALDLSLDEHDTKTEALARYYSGTALSAQSQYAAADQQLIAALKLFEEQHDTRQVASTYSFLGKDAWALGKSQDGLAYYEKALQGFESLGDLESAAGIHQSLAFFSSGETQMAHIQRGLELARAAGARSKEAILLQLWADFDYAQDDFESAFQRLEQARAILTELDDKFQLARVLTSLGRLYRVHGQPAEALRSYQDARAMQREVNDKQGEIQTLNAMGISLHALGRTTDALRTAEEGLQMARETGSPLLVKFMLEATASRHMVLREFAKSAELLEEARKMAPARHETLDLLSEVRFQLGQYAAALQASEESLSLGSDTGENRRNALQKKAQALFRLGRLAEALTATREVMDSYEQSRAKLVPKDFMKQGYAEAERTMTTFAIQVLMADGKQEEALEVAEQARGRAFLDLLATKNLLPDGAVLASLSTRGGVAAKPDGLSSRNISHPASAADMRALARRLDSTILSYWVDDRSTTVWTVSPQGQIGAVQTSIGADKLSGWIDDALNLSGTAVRRGDTKVTSRSSGVVVARRDTRTSWRSLYDALIRPIRSELSAKPGASITIIPSGPLFRLSFAALMDEKGRYLIEDYTVHYSPAAELFGFTLRNKERVAAVPAKYLLVANPSPLPTTPEGKPLARLPGSEEEVAAILRLLPADAVSTLRGSQAGEPGVRSAMPNATIIHLATHGIVDAADPLESFLALGRSSDQSDSDGRLTAQEVYGLDLHADLVVLSACRTGLGKISNDGVAGLARAFFYAGTASVVSTLWDVADQPAAQLVADFYRSLAAPDTNKSQALRAAQLHLLNALRKGQVRVDSPFGRVALPEDPVIWAGFVLMGEP